MAICLLASFSVKAGTIQAGAVCFNLGATLFIPRPRFLHTCHRREILHDVRRGDAHHGIMLIVSFSNIQLSSALLFDTLAPVSNLQQATKSAKSHKKKMSQRTEFNKSEHDPHRHRILVACCILVAISQLISTIQLANAQFSGESYYDPELQDEGIPVLRSPQQQQQYQHNVAPGVGWPGGVSGNGANGINQDDHQDLEDIQRANVAPSSSAKSLKGSAGLKRRNSYNEPEDGLDEDDEEDRDEYQSGSRNHGSYTENPSFGESKKAAKDGEDIESFFDKHLGPQEALEGAASNTNSDSPEAAVDETRANMDELAQSATDDPDEMYEAAASSPLATIIHSLLHKRPIVITTTDDDSPTTSDKEAAGSPQESSTSTSSDGTSSTSIVSNLLGASSAVQGSSSPQGGASASLAPIGYLSPLNTASSIVSYEPFGAQTALAEVAGGGGGGGQEANDDGNEAGQVREIYIGRRPSIFSSSLNRHHFQAYTPATSQSHANPMGALSWSQSASGEYSSARPLYPEGHTMSDYARYPVAASQNYQRDQSSASSPQEATNNNNNDDEEQTVSFGLSFSGHPSADSSSADEEDGSSGDSSDGADSDEQSSSSANNDPPAYVPYNTRNLMIRYPPKSSATSTDYNYPAIATSPDHLRVSRVGARPIMRAFEQQQQAPFNGARYHKDPTESGLTPQQQQQHLPLTSYNQYR